MKNRSFTLIELLIVIVIIGILAGLAKPHLDALVINAQGAEAMTNLRAIADSAWRYYLETGAFPDNNSQTYVEFDIKLTPAPNSGLNKHWIYQYSVLVKDDNGRPAFIILGATNFMYATSGTGPIGAKVTYNLYITRTPTLPDTTSVKLDNDWYSHYKHTKIARKGFGKMGSDIQYVPGW